MTLDEIPVADQRKALRTVAGNHIKKAEKSGRPSMMHREGFVREVVDHLNEIYGLGIRNLHVDAKTGVYQRLNSYMRGLFKALGQNVCRYGSGPDSLLMFLSDDMVAELLSNVEADSEEAVD